MSKALREKTSASNLLDSEIRTLNEEIKDNEEILFELDECLKNKNESIAQLKENISNLEVDIKRFTSPYNSEKATLEEDIALFRSIATKYVKADLVNFYIDRMRKCSASKQRIDNKKDHEELDAIVWLEMHCFPGYKKWTENEKLYFSYGLDNRPDSSIAGADKGAFGYDTIHV